MFTITTAHLDGDKTERIQYWITRDGEKKGRQLIADGDAESAHERALYRVLATAIGEEGTQ